MKSSRTSAQFLISDGGCWVRTGRRPFAALTELGWNPARYVGDDVVLAGTSSLRPTPIGSALEQLIRAGLGRSVKAKDRLTFIHPTHWGKRRIGQLEGAGMSLGCAVSCVPFAAELVQNSSKSGVTLVVECGELATCASVVGADGRIFECRYEPSLGTADVQEVPDRAARYRDLMDRPGIDHLVVTGARAVELDRIAAVAGRPGVVVAPGTAGFEEPPRPAGSVKTRLAGVPRRWWIAASALLLAVVVAGVFALTRPNEQSPGPAHTIEFGRAELLVPQGWTWQERPQPGNVQRRIDLSLPAHKDRRIIVTQNSVPQSTTLEDAKRSLRRQIVAEGEVFSDLDDVVYAGRQTIFYTEHPAGDDSEIRWYTMIDRGIQTGVGCQFKPGVWDAIASVCAQVVASVDVTR